MVADTRAADSASIHGADRYLQLVEAINEGVWTLDGDGRTDFVNPAMARMLGRTQEDMVGRPIGDFVDPGKHRLVERTLERCLRGASEVHEFPFLHADGSPVWTRISVKPLQDGDRMGALAVVTDITQHRAAQQALEEREQRLRDIVEHSTNLFYAHTPDHVLRYVSPQSHGFLGCSPEEARVHWTEFVTDHPANQEAFERTQRALGTGRRQPPFPLELRTRDGRIIWVEVNEAPVLRDGKVVGIVGALTDITARRRAEEAERTAREQREELDRLQEMDRFRSRFVNTAAHELNTPLTPALIQLELLGSGRLGHLTAKQQDAVGLVHRNLHRLQALVKDLLDAARMQMDRIPLDRGPVSLGAVVREVADTYRQRMRDAGLRFTVRCTGDLRLEGDGVRLHQVIANLVANALRFTPGGGRVFVLAAGRDDHVEVRVRDTGMGFNARQAGRLFRPFSQVHGTIEEDGGTGLGLYLCRSIVEGHGGRIEASSPGRGKGAVFTVVLPRRMNGS